VCVFRKRKEVGLALVTLSYPIAIGPCCLLSFCPFIYLCRVVIQILNYLFRQSRTPEIPKVHRVPVLIGAFAYFATLFLRLNFIRFVNESDRVIDMSGCFAN